MTECKNEIRKERDRQRDGAKERGTKRTFPNSCMPMTAKMKIMIQRTKVRLDRAPTVFIMIVRISFKDFHDLANLNTLNTNIHVLVVVVVYLWVW